MNATATTTTQLRVDANRTTILDENVAAAAAAPSSFMRESIGMYDI